MIKYEYNPDDPESWMPFTAPPFDKSFQRELELLAGKYSNGRPNLRLVWAGDLKDDRTESQVFLKYHMGYTKPKTVGFTYQQDGETFFTDNVETIPLDNLSVLPVIKSQPLGLPRWVIEKLTTPEHLKALNRFTNRTNEEGYKILRDFPRQGIYETWLIIDTKDNLYRDPGADLLPFIRAKWKLEQKPLDEQATLFKQWQVQQAKKTIMRRKEKWRASIQRDIVMPHEERLRREWLNNKIKEDLEMEQHRNNSVTVYQS